MMLSKIGHSPPDEFCLVFAETDKAAGIERAERLRSRIAGFDAGALRPSDAANANDLLERADEAMYHSKRTGRDAVSYVGADGALTRLEFADAR